MKIDFESHRIILENQIIYLTAIQNDILKLLHTNKGKIVKYETIAQKIYGIQCDLTLKVLIRKQISLLNKKIGEYIKIRNIKKVGYIIEEELI